MNKKQLLLAMLLSWGLGFLWRLLKRLVARAFGAAVEPRMCPACGYRTIRDVGYLPTRSGPPWAYCYCSACRHRYKHKGEGPLHPVGDDEWQRRTGLTFG